MRVASALMTLAVAAVPAVAVAGPSSLPIIGGDQTQVGDYPTVVVVEIGGNALCTGTLIHPNYVLTAAHCVDPQVIGVGSQAQVTAIVSVRFDSVTFGSGGRVIEAADTLKNPGFNLNDLGDDDIGLIELAEPVDDRMVSRVNRSAASAPIGVAVTFVGYGMTSAGGSFGRQFELVGKESVSCSLFGASDTNLLCFDQQDGTGQCQGDSGGPTFVEIEGAQTVVGVTSFGDQDCAILGADTRVDAEIAWVDQTIGDSLQCVWDGVCTAGCVGANNDLDCPQCATDDDCGDGMVCDAGSTCVPEPFSPGGLGAACVDDTECAGELCLINGEDHACSQTCNVDANDCPDGFDCMAFEDGGACWASPGGGGGGCAASGGDAGGPAGMIVILGFAGALVLRSRRGRRS